MGLMEIVITHIATMDRAIKPKKTHIWERNRNASVTHSAKSLCVIIFFSTAKILKIKFLVDGLFPSADFIAIQKRIAPTRRRIKTDALTDKNT
jgi:hypothetical protein